MGCLCCCLDKGQEDKPNVRTHLLPDGNVARDKLPISVRQYQSQKSREKKNLQETKMQFQKVEMKALCIPTMDKTFQDISKLFNDLLDTYCSLKAAVHEFKELFLMETAGIPIMSECIHILAKKAGTTTMIVTRKHKYSLYIDYKSKEITNRNDEAVEFVTFAVTHYNYCSKLICNIMERAPQIASSSKLILNDEQSFHKEILRAELGPQLEPEILINCNYNLKKLRHIQDALDHIISDTDDVFQEILDGSMVFFS